MFPKGYYWPNYQHQNMVQAANELHISEITEGDLAGGVERKCRIKCCKQERAKKYHCVDTPYLFLPIVIVFSNLLL